MKNLLPLLQPDAPDTGPTEAETAQLAVVPEPEALARAEKKITDELEKDFFEATSPSKKFELAKKLIELGETSDDPARRYIMWRQARDLAADAGQPVTMIAAVDHLAGQFRVDALDMKADALANFPPKTTTNAKAFNDAALKLVEESIAAKRRGMADRFAQIALEAAKATKNPEVFKKYPLFMRPRKVKTWPAATRHQGRRERCACRAQPPARHALVPRLRLGMHCFRGSASTSQLDATLQNRAPSVATGVQVFSPTLCRAFRGRGSGEADTSWRGDGHRRCRRGRASTPVRSQAESGNEWKRRDAAATFTNRRMATSAGFWHIIHSKGSAESIEFLQSRPAVRTCLTPHCCPNFRSRGHRCRRAAAGLLDALLHGDRSRRRALRRRASRQHGPAWFRRRFAD